MNPAALDWDTTADGETITDPLGGKTTFTGGALQVETSKGAVRIRDGRLEAAGDGEGLDPPSPGPAGRVEFPTFRRPSGYVDTGLAIYEEEHGYCANFRMFARPPYTATHELAVTQESLNARYVSAAASALLRVNSAAVYWDLAVDEAGPVPGRLVRVGIHAYPSSDGAAAGSAYLRMSDSVTGDVYRLSIQDGVLTLTMETP